MTNMIKVCGNYEHILVLNETCLSQKKEEIMNNVIWKWVPSLIKTFLNKTSLKKNEFVFVVQ